MPKEYRTIREVAGPLMMISDVETPPLASTLQAPR